MTNPTPMMGMILSAGCRVRATKCRVDVGFGDNYTPVFIAYLWEKIRSGVGCVGLNKKSVHVRKVGK